MLLVVGILALVAADVAGSVGHVLPPLHALSLAAGVEALLVRARVLARVRQPVYSTRLHSFLWTETSAQNKSEVRTRVGAHL